MEGWVDLLIMPFCLSSFLDVLLSCRYQLNQGSKECRWQNTYWCCDVWRIFRNSRSCLLDDSKKVSLCPPNLHFDLVPEVEWTQSSHNLVFIDLWKACFHANRQYQLLLWHSKNYCFVDLKVKKYGCFRVGGNPGSIKFRDRCALIGWH